MPLFLDRHNLKGATKEEVAQAHLADVEIQARYQVAYLTYWFDEQSGKGFCLAEGPSKDAVEAVHRDGHGLLAEQIIEVDAETVNAFMGALETHALGEAYEASGFRAILFTDVVGSTSLTEKLGDVAARRVMRALDDRIDKAIIAEGGGRVKHTGDGVMASFTTAGAAVKAALGIQAAVTDFNGTSEVPLAIRTGVSAGEPVCERGDLFGTAVQLAARLCALAESGEILVSGAVRELCRGRTLSFTSRGPTTLKGFTDPVEVHAAVG